MVCRKPAEKLVVNHGFTFYPPEIEIELQFGREKVDEVTFFQWDIFLEKKM
jgi:hypothetical protein